MTAGTKIRETRSTVFSIGARLPSARSTVRTIRASVLSPPIAAARTRITPLSFRLPPATLPPGYQFDRAVIAPDDTVVLWYVAPGKRLTLKQTAVEPGGASTMRMAMGEGSTLEEVSLDGRPAAWMNGHSLAWEADGRSFDLDGSELSLDEALEIARSIR